MPNDGADDRAPLHRVRMRVLSAVVAAGVVVVDQLTKVWAVDALAGGPHRVVGDTLTFDLRRNSGGAFSVLPAFTPLLAAVAVVVAVALVRILRRVDDPLLVASLSLLLGGALGNLVDRVVRSPGFLRGHVVDFVRFDGWPTNNVADAAITIGSLCLVIGLVRAERAERDTGRRAGAQEGS